MKTFAWQKSNRGPTPVIFHDGLPVDIVTGKLKNEDILLAVAIPHVRHNDLDKLAEEIPYREAA